jgi:hypothetical protein
MKQFLLVLLAVVPLGAQIRITGLEGLETKAKSSVEVGLDPAMLKLAGTIFSNGTADGNKAKALIENIKSITVRSFEFAQEGQYKIEDLAKIREQLRAPGWSKMVGVTGKQGRELTEIYAKSEQGKMAGVVIIAGEPKELTVVVIDGNIDLEAVAQLRGQFGIPNIPIPFEPKKGGKE